MDQNNPFKAPEARVADVVSDSGDFTLEGRKVEAGRGVVWITRGWELFRQAPGVWIGLGVVYVVILMAVGIIPFLGGIAVNVLLPIFLGGIMLGCKALDEGNDLTLGHLFAGFSNNTGNLAVAGLVYLLGIVVVVVIAIVIGVVFGIGAGLSGSSGGAAAILITALVSLIVFALIVPLAMAIWFAPALIVFNDVSPFDAMKASFFVCLKNVVPFLVYGLVYLIVAIIASIPLFLGWLVLIPVTMASIYAGYRDMFLNE